MALPPSLLAELRAVRGATVLVDAPLAPFTTIRTGGNCALLVTVQDASAVVEVLGSLKAFAFPWYCLGAGSDLLVADEGYSGAVVRLGEAFCYLEGLQAAPKPGAQAGGRTGASAAAPTQVAEGVLAVSGGGTPLARLAGAAAEAGLAGLEFACGIPGSVGGGVATNAGAYGRSLADVLTELQLATADGVRWVAAGELRWEYRHCCLPTGVVVTAARFRLARDDPVRILERHCSILEMRRSVQPQGVFTFGSTFKNPSGGAAGRLLEAAGLKGERRGGAEVSRVHANFVVNLGDASTAEVLALLSHMREKVHETSGVWLEPEIRLLGASFPWESSAGGSRRPLTADG
jgi:UDP-N-acetylenolpyruvoylglucosamine reductase